MAQEIDKLTENALKFVHGACYANHQTDDVRRATRALVLIGEVVTAITSPAKDEDDVAEAVRELVEFSDPEGGRRLDSES